MKTYSNSATLRNDGIDPSTLEVDLNAGIGLSVTVRIASLPVPGVGALAAIFDINDNLITNPIPSTDNNGNFTFRADSIVDVIIDEGGVNIIRPSVDLADSAGVSLSDVRKIASSASTNTASSQTLLDVDGVDLSLIRAGYTSDGLVWAIPQGSTGILDGTYAASSAGATFGLQGGGSIVAPQLIGSIAGGEIKTPLNAPTDHILFQSRAPGAYRAHMEPSGVVENGTVTKLDWMLDPYDGGPLVPYPSPNVNYRIFNIFTKTGTSPGLNGENGAAIIGTKNRGDGNQWGVFTSMHFGFNDGARTCAKMYYFDTSDTEWRTPMKGQWYETKPLDTGDHVLYGPGKLYVAASSGICGGNPPVHSSGTVSDGGVNLTFVRDFTAHTGDIKPVMMIGDRDIMPVFGWPQVRMQVRESTLNTPGARQLFSNQANGLAASVGVRAGEDNWAVETETLGSKLEVSDDAVIIKNKALILSKLFFNSNDQTIPVGNNSTVSINQSIPTTVQFFTDLIDGTEFTVISSNSNTTIENSAAIRLGSIGGPDILLTPYKALKFHVSGTTARLITNQ